MRYHKNDTETLLTTSSVGILCGVLRAKDFICKILQGHIKYYEKYHYRNQQLIESFPQSTNNYFEIEHQYELKIFYIRASRKLMKYK